MGTGAPPSGVIHRNRQEHRRPCAYRAHTTGAATQRGPAPASCPNAPRTGVGLILRCVCGCPAPTNGLSASVRLPTPPHRPFDQLHFSGHCTFRYCTFGSCTILHVRILHVRIRRFPILRRSSGDDSTDLPSVWTNEDPNEAPGAGAGAGTGGARCRRRPRPNTGPEPPGPAPTGSAPPRPSPGRRGISAAGPIRRRGRTRRSAGSPTIPANSASSHSSSSQTNAQNCASTAPALSAVPVSTRPTIAVSPPCAYTSTHDVCLLV
jgi:hypothetical protein